MNKLWIAVASCFLFFLLSPSLIYAKQSTRADDTTKAACEISGGTWTESGRNWVCCWADWGCYGCSNNICKIKCYNERCRRANGLSHVSAGHQRVKGLAPEGMTAPVAPKLKKTTKTNLKSTKQE